jgi:RNA polymerase sigma-70 factor (ECF subfamily)
MTADWLSARLLEAPLVPDEARATERTGRAEMPTVAEIYDAHVDYIWRCLRSLGVQPTSLDDAVQDVFMVVHQKLAEFDGACQLRTWMYAIAIRIARRYRRQRAGRDVELDAEPVAAHCTERAVASREALALAQRALDALDADKREVFVLAEVEQMSAPEIAEVLGIPVNTVYSRLRAARQAFSLKVARRAATPRRSP